MRNSSQNNTLNNDGKSLLRQDQIGAVLGNTSSRVNRDTHVSISESTTVVDSIAKHTNTMACLFKTRDNQSFLLGRHFGKDATSFHGQVELGGIFKESADVESNGERIACKNLDTYSELSETGNGLFRIVLGWIGEADDALEGHVCLEHVNIIDKRLSKRSGRQEKNTVALHVHLKSHPSPALLLLIAQILTLAMTSHG
ncbi:hypothetical protein HG530_011556 [Fusarium avenaceum]|nr:hypothetical protein HG530_011556 [Fusarium avenaceum]